jgi:hypothetical protein
VRPLSPRSSPHRVENSNASALVAAVRRGIVTPVVIAADSLSSSVGQSGKEDRHGVT